MEFSTINRTIRHVVQVIADYDRDTRSQSQNEEGPSSPPFKRLP